MVIAMLDDTFNISQKCPVFFINKWLVKNVVVHLFNFICKFF